MGSTAEDQPVVHRPGVIDLGRMGYADALAVQREHHRRVVAARGDLGARESGASGVILLVEHGPVITVSRRKGAAAHVLADAAALARAGVVLEPTDRGGDVTYHGPGQVVCYPIIDLNAYGLRLHEYMRLLEETVIRTIARFGVVGARDTGATGVWVSRDGKLPAKIAAMGVRVSRWVSMHGLALNVSPDLGHFGLIDPCGLGGRPVTSLAEVLGDAPSMDDAKRVISDELLGLLAARVGSLAARGSVRNEERPTG